MHRPTQFLVDDDGLRTNDAFDRSKPSDVLYEDTVKTCIGLRTTLFQTLAIYSKYCKNSLTTMNCAENLPPASHV